MGVTLVIGASHKPERASYQAVQKLSKAGIPFEMISNREIEIFGKKSYNAPVHLEDIDTITLYINPGLQAEQIDYWISLKPSRIIFNPGTENPDIYPYLSAAGIRVLEACTLVLLSTGQYLNHNE